MPLARAKADPTVVIKIGGSLLTQNHFPARLRSWLANDSQWTVPTKRIFLVGGGPTVEALRAIDRANPLPTSLTHSVAVETMDLHAQLLASWLPEATLTEQYERLTRFGDWIFSPGRWLPQEEPGQPGVPLPTGWQVTSDSIAARLAATLGCRLILLKSRLANDFGSPINWTKAAGAGFVDPEFPSQSATIESVQAWVLAEDI